MRPSKGAEKWELFTVVEFYTKGLEETMPTLTINGKTFEVDKGLRLVTALEQAGIRIGHRCGGVGECTSCRVKFLQGEPDVMTEAEYSKLAESGLLGKQRLSCQIEIDRDMVVDVLETVDRHPEWSGDPGPEPGDLVEPEAVWYPIDEMKNWN